ncbi:MAG: PspC domain-containing protein [Cyclobacteriaceae bacterium]|nr:PspC domain-containing protein [Cyclobacteriaceae bacterium]
MKKNISINISGIIFHIEEDGYDKLKAYLESINRYFSNFEDSHEIIADIETRIAEIFLSKLKEGKQVIALEDVDSLVATMGSIKDFQAAEEDSEYIAAQENESEESESQGEPLFSKKLYRDNKRKLVAGVLSGIAFYLNTDALWVRLIYVILFFGVWILPSIAGFLFIAYIILWIAVPASDELIEHKKIKKMYRDPDAKVLGGVASGVAAYFGVDMVIIRILFFVAIFAAGTGLILYIILWIILPEAKTLTDKMEMQGQPVTLSNIESNIKKSLKVSEGEENLLMKILLFPFRLIAALFEFLTQALGPFLSFLVEALRVVMGVILAIIGLSGILVVLIALGVLVGLIAGGDLNTMFPLPLEVIKNDLSILPVIAFALLLIIPAFFTSILGFMVLMKKRVLNARAGWSILALWFISIIILSFTIPSFIRNLRETGRFTDVERYDLYRKTLKLSLNDIGADEYDLVSLRIRSSEDTVVRLEKEFIASGASRTEAVNNAKMINYGIDISDSVFRFDSSFKLDPNSGFRKQHVDLTLYIPIGQNFVMEEDMKYLQDNFLFREGFSDSDMRDNVWAFDSSGLKCTTCPIEKFTASEEHALSHDWDISGYSVEHELAGFSEVEVGSAIKVMISRGDSYRVVASGNKKMVDELEVHMGGSVLSLDYDGKHGKIKREDELVVHIAMPEISALELSGASKVYVSGMSGDFLDIKLHGAAFAAVDANVSSVTVEVDGASKLQLSGTGDRLEAHVSGASTFSAFEYLVSETEIEASSAGSAMVYASDRLVVKSSGASKVSYRGDADVEIDKSGGSSVNRD